MSQNKNTILPYKSLNSVLKSKFGERVHKISVNSNLSCPNRDGTKGTEGCIFCSPVNLLKKSHFPKLSITDQIVEGKKYVEKRFGAHKFIAYFQHYSNTYAPTEQLYEFFTEALRVDGIVGLSISTRPDCVNEESLDMIEDLGKESYVWIEYGLQSANNKTLEIIGRKDTVENFVKVVRKTASRPHINISAHIIAGLPGETLEDILRTVNLIGSLNIHGIKIHHLYIVKNTPLHLKYEEGKVSTLSLEEYLEILFEIIVRLPPEIIIHRLFGEAPPHLLVAPRWPVRKNVLIKKIRSEMKRRGLFQGQKY